MSLLPIRSMKFFCKELKVLMSIVLIVPSELRKGCLLAKPRIGQHLRSNIAGCSLLGVKGLEKFIHAAAQAVVLRTLSYLVSITEVEVSKKGVMHKTLQNNAHKASASHIKNATKPGGTAWRGSRIYRHVCRVVFRRVCERLVPFSFSACAESIRPCLDSGYVCVSYLKMSQCQFYGVSIPPE